jgi:ubiquinone/menaquinone biosynthesis C-methylase UbiE
VLPSHSGIWIHLVTWLAQLEAYLAEGQVLREVEDHIHSVLAETEPAFYDKGAWLYDLIVGSRAYNKLAWGCSVDRYEEACRNALAVGTGPLADVGCGSLVFTATAYLEVHDRLIILIDQSLGMLRRARHRLRQSRGQAFENIILLQADATRLPFKSKSFAQTMSWGVLHVMPDRDVFLDEMIRITRSDGVVDVSSLVTDRHFGRRYLQMLQRTGEVSALLTSSNVEALMCNRGLSPRMVVTGNMAFVAGHNALIDYGA